MNRILDISNCKYCESERIFCCYVDEENCLIHCLNCGVYFFGNTPVEKELTEYYKKNYSEVHQKQLFKLLKEYFEEGQYKNAVKNILLKYDKKNFIISKFLPLKILDFGCSYAFFLKEAKNEGMKTIGIEFDDEVSKYNQEELGIEMITLNQLEEIKDESLDILRANHAIEHLPDPNKILKIFYKKLKKNGIIWISTPCFSEKLVQTDITKLYDFVYPEHLSYFTTKSMRKMLEKIGFEVEICTSQFANTEQVLRIIGIENSDFEYEFDSELKKILEKEPFQAGSNLFVVARKISKAIDVKKIEKQESMYIHTLKEHSCQNIHQEFNFDSKSRGTHFVIKSNQTWKILFPIKRKFQESRIYVSGNMISLEARRTLIQISLLNKYKESFSNKSQIFLHNNNDSFLFYNDCSSEDFNYVCISGNNECEFFIHDFVCTEVAK